MANTTRKADSESGTSDAANASGDAIAGKPDAAPIDATTNKASGGNDAENPKPAETPKTENEGASAQQAGQLARNLGEENKIPKDEPKLSAAEEMGREAERAVELLVGKLGLSPEILAHAKNAARIVAVSLGSMTNIENTAIQETAKTSGISPTDLVANAKVSEANLGALSSPNPNMNKQQSRETSYTVAG